MLRKWQVEGTVVVARWYGGQPIGREPFRHITTCAQQAIARWRAAEDKRKRQEASEQVDQKAEAGLRGPTERAHQELAGARLPHSPVVAGTVGVEEGPAAERGVGAATSAQTASVRARDLGSTWKSS
ncbi:hypothetical protein BDW02DRAFT_573671 [Decorospora gaudefroyi]|uniref:Impact N-terminal domain-containing protein n=1 Tax=Decorospora gaudefroyi TaxID=184978 RepID=A0A6A5K8Q6_9PLEO|nr:hypothetical protein BDW02DRAFT_573671 [Decorospora gaudefroyi]